MNDMLNGGGWECAVCTYSNDATQTNCVMCGLANPNKAKAQAPNQMQPPLWQQPMQPRPIQQPGPIKYPSSPNMLIGGMGNGNGHGANGQYNPQQQQQHMNFSNQMIQNGAHKVAATVSEFQQSASEIAWYNDNPSQVFSTLRSVAKKLLKDDVRYRTLDTKNPKVTERLIGYEGVLDFLTLLGFESDSLGLKLVCEQKPSPLVVRNAIEVLNTYESRLGLGRNKKNHSVPSSMNNKEADGNESYCTLGGPGLGDKDDGNGGDADEDNLTLEQIIIWSTHENMRDSDTMETLVLTHKQFTNSLTLLKNLRRRFDVPIPNDIRSDDVKTNEFRQNVQKRIQLKVIKSLRDWMKTYWDDDFLHDLELQKELALWLADLAQQSKQKQRQCPWIAPLSNMVNKEYERFKLKSPNQSARANALKFSPKTGVPTSLERVPIKKGYKLSSTTAEDLADQITVMDFNIFSHIAERECIGQAWKKKKEQSPNVLAMINQFNNLTVFVQLQILQEKSLKDRGKAIKRVIKMGERFKTLKNYNSLCAVLGALNSSPIHRLKSAWQRVPEKQLNLFESFKQIFVNTRNFRNFRQLFRNMSPPAIPYFGLFLQDLVFIDDGNDQYKKIDNFKQHGFMVNFNKCVRTMDRIKNIKLYQTNPYVNGKHVKSLDFLQKILYAEFFNMKDYTEDKIWNISTAVKKADEKAAGIKKK